MSQLTQNTADLDALIAKANALPDAGAGGGGGSVETCTVTIDDPYTPTVYYCRFMDGVSEFATVTLDYERTTLENVVKNSYIIVYNPSYETTIDPSSCTGDVSFVTKWRTLEKSNQPSGEYVTLLQVTGDGTVMMKME